MPATLPRASEELITGFAERVARRDEPRPDLTFFSPERVADRVAGALEALLPRGRQHRRATLARLCLVFVGQPAATVGELDAVSGVHPQTGSRLRALLQALGLLEARRVAGRREFGLSRWGEDWLLAAVRGEVAPARPS
ncbi:hypothetical protein [Hymenobacter sp. B81]|uniref:hypothetical protein n=1 Tax=Hymenobacter sp. B81 TaxID=3344878 RepID=UPI0037DD9399